MTLAEANQYPHYLKDIFLFTKDLWSRIIFWSPPTDLVFGRLEMAGWDQHVHHEQFRNNFAKTQRSRIVPDSSGIIMQRLKEAGLFRNNYAETQHCHHKQFRNNFAKAERSWNGQKIKLIANLFFWG